MYVIIVHTQACAS